MQKYKLLYHAYKRWPLLSTVPADMCIMCFIEFIWLLLLCFTFSVVLLFEKINFGIFLFIRIQHHYRGFHYKKIFNNVKRLKSLYPSIKKISADRIKVPKL